MRFFCCFLQAQFWRNSRPTPRYSNFLMTCSSENLHSHISDLKPLLLAKFSLILILLFFDHDLLSYPLHSCLLFSSVPSALTTSYSSGISSSMSSWPTCDSESRLSHPHCGKHRHNLLQCAAPSFKICLPPFPWFHRLPAPLHRLDFLTSTPSIFSEILLNQTCFFLCVCVLVWSSLCTDYNISHFYPACFHFTALHLQPHHFLNLLKSFHVLLKILAGSTSILFATYLVSFSGLHSPNSLCYLILQSSSSFDISS